MESLKAKPNGKTGLCGGFEVSGTRLSVDFGTSNSLVGAVKDGKRLGPFAIDPNSTDPSLMRTLLYFGESEKVFYGADALNEFIAQDMSGRLFRSIKAHLPNQSYLGTLIDNKPYPLEKLIGLFLLELKKRAEKILGESVQKLTLGRPARYSMDPVSESVAVHRMKKACEFAGFTEVDFVPEPLAAALDYRAKISEEKMLLVGDFGGGTSDFTVMKVSPRSFEAQDVLGVDGCSIAGDALDSLFMSERLNEYFGAKATYKMPMSTNHLAMPPSVMIKLNRPAHIAHLKEADTFAFIQEVRKCALNEEHKKNIDRLMVLVEDQQAFPFFEVIEHTKRGLSEQSEMQFKFEYPDLRVGCRFKKSEFETWAKPSEQQIFLSLDRCLSSAGVKDQDVDVVFLTGGTAKVPFIEQEFARRFGLNKMQKSSFFHSVLAGLTESAWLKNQNKV